MSASTRQPHLFIVDEKAQRRREAQHLADLRGLSTMRRAALVGSIGPKLRTYAFESHGLRVHLRRSVLDRRWVIRISGGAVCTPLVEQRPASWEARHVFADARDMAAKVASDIKASGADLWGDDSIEGGW